MPDDYASLGPDMRSRLDEAEIAVSRMMDWLKMLAERGPEANLIAREMAMVMDWPSIRSNIEHMTYPWERA
jgi:hypothetical protein